MLSRSVALWLCVVVFGWTPLLAVGSPAPLADAVQRLDRDAIDGFLTRSIDVNGAQADGMTALHWATYYDEVDLVERLVMAGAM